MEINLIPKTNGELINKCIELAKKDYLENIVLLGDLFPPCINLTDIYGIFEDNQLISFFTIFNGFQNPSIILPKTFPENEAKFLTKLGKILPTRFILVSFTLKEEDLINYFSIEDESAEYCMFSNQSSFNPIDSNLAYMHVTEDTVDQIDEFYRSIHTYPWNPLQIESNYYFFQKIDGKIIACGGTHFETPDAAHLGNIIVIPEYRRQSRGIELVSTITSEILKTKQFVTLFVTQNNIPAINLYKKLGFYHYKPVSIFSCKFK